MAYIDLPIETDADTLKDEAVDSLTAAIPGWEAAAGNLETILLEAIAEMAVEQATVAAQVPSAIFRAFGQRLIGLDPIDGVEAIGSTTWTLADTDGHTLVAGTFITVGEVAFQTSEEVTVPIGESSASIPIVAVEPGEQGNDLTGAAVAVDTIAYVVSVAIVGSTSGGVDAETDEEYLSRLAEELTLMAPRPIVPEDFEILARRIAGVSRSVAIDGWNPDADTSFTATRTNTSPILTVVSSFTGIAIGSLITGTGIPADSYVIAKNVGGSTLTLSKNATSSAAGATYHSIGSADNERMIAIASVDDEGAAVSGTIKTSIEDDLEARREVTFVVNAIDPTYTEIDVTADVTILPGFDAATVLDVAEAALNDYLDSANFGRVTAGDGRFDRPWILTTKVGYLNIARTILMSEGVAFINSLTVNGGTTDVTLAGPAPLTTPGTIAVTGA